MILLIDNYDSFSYNLYQIIGELLEKIAGERSTDPPEAADPVREGGKRRKRESGRAILRVIRSDELSVQEIAALEIDGIILSPGPGRPADAGVCIEAVRTLGEEIPILGVCLGHQAICEAYGAQVSYAKELMHGKQSLLRVDTQDLLFAGCPGVMEAGRYHSLAAVEETMPACLLVTARSEDGEIMAVRHRDNPVWGVQFHPESILTPEGPRLLENWVRYCLRGRRGTEADS